MKHILLFGAGKSASVLIDYLIQLVIDKNWHLTIADANEAVVKSKSDGYNNVTGVALQIQDDAKRKELVADADIVISLMPPALHFIVAKDCVAAGKNLLTASYVDDNIRSLEKEIKEKSLLFLCEMGLDPGIDHMSAMQVIHRIKLQGGKITSFKSHCGGLVAPESDDNPWHYKISWNPRNVVVAGKAGAIYKENNEVVEKGYRDLFNPAVGNILDVPGNDIYAFYPNRDSLGYIPVYGLEDTHTFIRTTLRHPAFITGWDKIIELRLTDEEKVYDTTNLSFAAFFLQHLERFRFANWFEKATAKQRGAAFMSVDSAGNLSMAEADETGTEQAIVEQLYFLGFDDGELINKGVCSAADVLQLALEKKLILRPEDKDLVIMMHEFEYTLNGKQHALSSTLSVTGEDSVHTAMAKTVGLPLGIAAKLILEEEIAETGLHIPISPAIYEPVLQELQQHGIIFKDEEK